MCVGDGYENEIVDLVPLVSDSSLCQIKNCRHVFWPVENLCDQHTLPPLTKNHFMIKSYPCVQLDVLFGQDGAFKQEENLEWRGTINICILSTKLNIFSLIIWGWMQKRAKVWSSSDFPQNSCHPFIQ